MRCHRGQLAGLQNSYLTFSGMLFSMAALADQVTESPHCNVICVCLQDVSGGNPVKLQGTDLPLYGMEIDVAGAAEEIRSIGKDSDGGQVCGAHLS